MEGQKDVDFRKAIKLGAGNTMRSSDLRKLVVEAKILGDMSATGLQVQKVLGTKVQIFSVPESGEPLFFQTNKKGPLYPTLYAVWKGLILHLPVVETSETALESIQRGSDLFAPGIQSVSSDNVQKNDVVLVCVDGKIVGVGKAVSALSGLESGSAVCVLHCFGDSVWQLGSKCDPCPLPSREAEVIEPEKVEEVAVTLSVAETDEMMKEAFVLALRGLKKAEFPLLFSTFAAKMTLSSPKPFNVKQSSFKKIGAFLLSMAKDEKVIKVNEKSPGVLEIVEVDRQSALYRKFKEHSTGEAAAVAVEVPPVAEVLFSIPKRMKHLFVGQENSELMSKMEARELLLLRVKEKAMLMQEKSGWARMDEELQAALKSPSTEISMNALITLWLDSLDHHTRTFKGSVPVVKKGVAAPILVKEERKANKDRTSVSGLERFGIDAEDLSKRCAIQFAASASVSESNGVLIVQGLRGNEIFKMLKEEYRVPKEFVTLQSKASK